MDKRWSDFLFAVVVRLLCGLIIGFLAGLVLGWQLILRGAARDDANWSLIWLISWGIGGAVVALWRIPHWQRPWYKGMHATDDHPAGRIDYLFRRIPPELYNRAAHPSLKQFHEFVKWLRESTVVQLECVHGDSEGTKAAFVNFFQRGLKAGLLLSELTDLVPSIVARVGYSESQLRQIRAMLESLDLDQLGIKLDGAPPHA